MSDIHSSGIDNVKMTSHTH